MALVLISLKSFILSSFACYPVTLVAVSDFKADRAAFNCSYTRRRRSAVLIATMGRLSCRCSVTEKGRYQYGTDGTPPPYGFTARLTPLGVSRSLAFRVIWYPAGGAILGDQLRA